MIRYLFSKFKFYIKKIFLLQKKSLTVIIPKESILKYLPQNPVIIDCGAHIGTDTIDFAKYQGSTVYAFEPIKYIFDKLVLNTNQYKNVSNFNFALSSCDGFADMYVSTGSSDGSSSLLKPKKHLKFHPDVFFNRVERVNCKTLDTWAKENNVNRIDLLWLDMQGSEKAMLMVSDIILETVSVIHTEVSLYETYEGMGNYFSLKKFLKNKGFKVVIEAIPKNDYGGNVLFVRDYLLK